MPFFFLVSLMISSARAEGVAATTPAASEATPAPTPSAAAAAAAPSAAAPAPHVPEVKMTSVTKVVGEAGPRVVTSREVRINEAVSQILSAPSANRAAKSKVLTVDDPNFPAQVLKVLDEWTVFLEANEIGSKSADKAEVNRLVKNVTDAWKGVHDWEKLEASATEIREIVERKLSAQSLERLKGDASMVNVSDAEALQYYKKNRLRFGNLPFENFKDNIKAALVRTQTERRLTEWRAVLRRKYRVRTFVGA